MLKSNRLIKELREYGNKKIILTLDKEDLKLQDETYEVLVVNIQDYADSNSFPRKLIHKCSIQALSYAFGVSEAGQIFAERVN